MRQALELALKALEEFGEHYNWCHQFPTYASPEEYPPCNCGYDKAITAIKEALAQPEEEKLHPVHIGVDVTKEGTAVTAFYRKPDAVMEMFYSQFHPMAQPEQEPVAFYVYKPTLPRGNLGNVLDSNLPWVYDQDPSSGYSARMLVYTTPPQRKPLTDEEIKQDFEKWAKDNYVQGFELYGDSYHNGHTRNRWQGWLAAHRAIEAAHGIKE